MRRILLSILLTIFVQLSFAQPIPHLRLQKNGLTKKKIEEGTAVILQDKQGFEYAGRIQRLERDTIWFSNSQVAVADLASLRFTKRKHQWPEKKELLYSALGTVFSTTAMTVSGLETFRTAAIGSAGLAFTPYLVQQLLQLKPKKRIYRFGKKYQVKIWSIDQPLRSF